MQDDYVKTFAKIKMDDDRKNDMRKMLENEMASSQKSAEASSVKPAKTTRLTTGAKVGIAAAAIAVTMGGLFVVPASRNAIYASVRSLFGMEVPEGAEDGVTKELEDRENRVVPTDEDLPEEVIEEIASAVESQDQAADFYFDSVIVTADYYEDTLLNEYANYYAQQGYTLLDIAEDDEIDEYYDQFEAGDWYDTGFFVSYHIGDNAYGYEAYTYVFKASEEQFQAFLQFKLNYINYERTEHGQPTVMYEDFWSTSIDEEGNTVYQASWVGPDPVLKLEPSDCARFANYSVMYDAENQLVVCYVEEGGGVG